ncbi:MAG: type IV pilus modification protein PilV [Methylococcaceae bacterium]|nr:type IV pilus modification protein PilV [Methylococcaceae bacterium]MDP3904386.1 type IV pilus modification protein PilV [Methylococcaceae bacterium]
MNKNTGFTLIEVLIAMLVLAVGLLGLAGLQATSLKNNQSAYNRSQATQLAYDLADRIRANLAGKTTYTTGTATATAACLTTAGCTKEAMAENDLKEWNDAITATLPSGTGTIAVDAGVFTITITWDDDHDDDTTNNPNFQTSFQL